MPPGSYGLKLRELGWTAVRYLRFLVDPAFTGLESMTVGGSETTIGPSGGTLEVGKRDPHPVRDGLLAMIPGAHDDATADLSEQLGPMANQDVGLWLSLIGATRILGPRQFRKMGGLPLMSFDDVKPGSAPVYVLAGFDKDQAQLSVVVESVASAEPKWIPMQPVNGVSGLFEFRADGPPGAKLVRFRIGDRAPMSTLTYTLPDRATLFVLASDTEGGTRIHQFILPLPSLSQSTQTVALRAIRFITLAQKQVARRRPATPPDDADAEDIKRWKELLSGDWLDPVMGLLAAYELANNSRAADAEKLPGLVQSLRAAYPLIPDVELVAKLAGLPYTEPTGTPLILTGYHALDRQSLPLPAGKLDYNGPWLTWLGV